MKLKRFLQDTFSPSKGSVKLNTKGIIEDYRERYDQLIASGKKFQHDAYTTTKGRVIVHIKVPSETIDGKFFYDVLFELTAEKSAVDFRDCNIKVFSNCPSFVYSVAYVFAHWNPDDDSGKKPGMMIDSLRGKLPRERMLIPGTEKALGREPVHDKPVVRNPMGIPLFDKSLYFAVFHMLDEMNFNQTMHNHNNVSMSRVIASVASFDSLMAQRKRLEAKQKRDKEKKQAAVDQIFEDQEKTLQSKNRLTPHSPAQKPRTAIRVGTTSATKLRQPKRIGR